MLNIYKSFKSVFFFFLHDVLARTFLVRFLYIQDLSVVSGCQDLDQGVFVCAQTLRKGSMGTEIDTEKDHLFFTAPPKKTHLLAS